MIDNLRLDNVEDIDATQYDPKDEREKDRVIECRRNLRQQVGEAFKRTPKPEETAQKADGKHQRQAAEIRKYQIAEALPQRGDEQVRPIENQPLKRTS